MNPIQVYEITYDYCSEEGYEETNITERFECETYQQLKDYIKQMRKNGCYNINASFLYEYTETLCG